MSGGRREEERIFTCQGSPFFTPKAAADAAITAGTYAAAAEPEAAVQAL